MDVATCIAAYCRGAFPMDGRGAPEIAFCMSDPRTVLPLDGFRVPRSVARGLRREGYDVRIDTAFAHVVRGCGGARDGGEWLTPRLVRLYDALHAAGYAHSVEAWRGDELCGGLFGVAIGGLFTSESMFHRAADAGNAAVVHTWHHLRDRGYTLWDIQMATPHTRRFGAVDMDPDEYAARLREALPRPVAFTSP